MLPAIARAFSFASTHEKTFYTNEENNGIMKPSFGSVGEVNRAIDKASSQLNSMHHEQYLKMINGETDRQNAMTPIINGKKKEIEELESLRANMLGVGNNGGWTNSKSLLPKKPVGSYTSGRERISGAQTPEQERKRQHAYAPGTGDALPNWDMAKPVPMPGSVGEQNNQRGVDNPAKNDLIYRIEGLDPTKPFMPQYEEYLKNKGREAWEAWLESERNPQHYGAQPCNAEHSGEGGAQFLSSTVPGGQMGLNGDEKKDEEETAEERIGEINQEITRISEQIDSSFAWMSSGAISGEEYEKHQQIYNDGLARIQELENESKELKTSLGLTDPITSFVQGAVSGAANWIKDTGQAIDDFLEKGKKQLEEEKTRLYETPLEELSSEDLERRKEYELDDLEDKFDNGEIDQDTFDVEKKKIEDNITMIELNLPELSDINEMIGDSLVKDCLKDILDIPNKQLQEKAEGDMVKIEITDESGEAYIADQVIGPHFSNKQMEKFIEVYRYAEGIAKEAIPGDSYGKKIVEGLKLIYHYDTKEYIQYDHLAPGSYIRYDVNYFGTDKKSSNSIFVEIDENGNVKQPPHVYTFSIYNTPTNLKRQVEMYEIGGVQK